MRKSLSRMGFDLFSGFFEVSIYKYSVDKIISTTLFFAGQINSKNMWVYFDLFMDTFANKY